MLEGIHPAEEEREIRKESEAPALIVPFAPEGFAIEKDAPVVQGKDAGETMEQRGLAGAVEAEHGDDAAGRKNFVQSVEDTLAAKAFGKAIQFNFHAPLDGSGPRASVMGKIGRS